MSATAVESHEGRRLLGGAALVVSAAMMWASFGPIAQLLYGRGFTPVELASVRTWIALAGALIVGIAMRQDLRIRLRSIPFFALYGVVGFAAFELLLLLCLERVSVPVAISLLYTAPLFVALLGRFGFDERIGALHAVALVPSVAGVFFVSGTFDALSARQATIPAAGLFLGLGAGAGYALYTMFGRIASRRGGSFASVFWCFFFAAIALAFIADPIRPVIRDPGALPLLIALGIVPTLLPYLLFVRALRTLPSATASMLACSEPLFAATWAALLVGARMTGSQAIGMALIVASGMTLALPRRRALTEPAAASTTSRTRTPR